MECVKHQICKLLYIFHQRETPEKYNLLHASPTLQKKDDPRIRNKAKRECISSLNINFKKGSDLVTGKGTNCMPDATNGL